MRDIFEENFKGTKRNEKQYKKLMNLQTVAKKLKGLQDPIFECNIFFGATDNKQRSCIVCVEGESPVLMMQKSQIMALAEMMMIADDVSTAYVKDKGLIRYTFGVRDVWE